MSSTRRAKNGEFHQNRYASSPEFERGISAALTARRCSILDDSADRLIVWFVQWLSWHPGGLEKLSSYLENEGSLYCSREHLTRLCVDPETSRKGVLTGLVPIDKIRQYRRAYMKDAGVTFNTALGKKVFEILDYTSYSSGLTLMEGEARTGKTFAAKAWCEQRAGGARFVEVPSGNDDSGFFRALARGLGLGNFLQYKAREIRERVESVLLSHDLILVLDEAQRLWPQRNLRYGYPHRIVWAMSMANAGVPIAMVSTPQFTTIQKAIEKNGWNSAQLTGRIKHYESLPPKLSDEDLKSVAKSVLTGAEIKALQALAIYARNSARCLAAIDSISTRANYIAMKDGRAGATTADVRKAMQESVIPSDNKLVMALEAGRKTKRAQTETLEAPDVSQAQPCERQSLERVPQIREPSLIA